VDRIAASFTRRPRTRSRSASVAASGVNTTFSRTSSGAVLWERPSVNSDIGADCTEGGVGAYRTLIPIRIYAIGSRPDEVRASAQPPLEVRLGGSGLAPEQIFRDVARLFDQRDIALEVGEAQQRHAGLLGTEELAGTADREVLARDLEAVV